MNTSSADVPPLRIGRDRRRDAILVSAAGARRRLDAAGVRSCLIVVATLTVAGWPAVAAAQPESFFRGLAELRMALNGTYGDEGRSVVSRLDELAGHLAAWDASIRERELLWRAELADPATQDAAAIHTALGSMFMQRSRYADAVVEFAVASRLAPEQGVFHLLHALALEAAGQSADAALAFRMAWEAEPADPVKAYLALTRSSPDEASSQRMGQTLMNAQAQAIRGAFEGAAAPFPQVRPFAGDAGGAVIFAPASYAEGFALHLQGRHAMGLAALRAVAARDPLVTDAVLQSASMQRGSAALRKGDADGALKAFQAAVQEAPMSTEAHRMLALAYRLSGDRSSSIEHLETVLRLRPDDERSWISLVRAKGYSSGGTDAMHTLEEAVVALPRSGELHWTLSVLAIQQQNLKVALDHATAAAGLAVLAGDGFVHREVSNVAAQLQQLDRSAEAAERRARLAINDAEAHWLLARTYNWLGRQDAAFRELAVAVWLDPDDPVALLELGQSHLTAGNDSEAIVALERAVAKDPSLADARYALGQALRRAGRDAEARVHLAEFQRLLEVSRERQRPAYEILLRRSAAQRAADDGDDAGAIQALADVVKLEPDVPSNHFELAEALVSAGQLVESIPHYAKAAELGGVAEVHLRLSVVLAKLGRAEESAKAREVYQQLWLEDLRRGIR